MTRTKRKTGGDGRGKIRNEKQKEGRKKKEGRKIFPMAEFQREKAGSFIQSGGRTISLQAWVS